MLNHLPLEILIIIINYLNYEDVCSLLLLESKRIEYACRKFKKIVINRITSNKNICPVLKHFDNPSELTISNNNNKDEIIDIIIKRNWQLKIINFYNARYCDSDCLLDLMKNQQKIELLNLHSCWQIKKVHLQHLSPKIKHLFMRNNSITAIDLKELNKFHNLETLDICYSLKFLDKNIKDIKLKNLKYLNIANCLIGNNEKTEVFFGNIDSLEQLNISFCDITMNLLIFLNKKHNYLEKLVMNGIMFMEHNFNFNFEKNWNNLKYLDISYTSIDDYLFSKIRKHISNIEDLRLTSTFITNISIIDICLYLKKIKNLYIGNNNINYHSYNHIITYCKLEKLDISHTDIKIYYLNKILLNNRLTYLGIVNCRNIIWKNIDRKNRNILIL